MNWPKTKKQILWETIYHLRGHGLKQSEIAERIGITQQAVAYQLKRMREYYLESEILGSGLVTVQSKSTSQNC